jgi:hypothetical protein
VVVAVVADQASTEAEDLMEDQVAVVQTRILVHNHLEINHHLLLVDMEVVAEQEITADPNGEAVEAEVLLVLEQTELLTLVVLVVMVLLLISLELALSMVVVAAVLTAAIQYALQFLVVLAVVDPQDVWKAHQELQTLAAVAAEVVTAEVQDKHARVVTAVKAL